MPQMDELNENMNDWTVMFFFASDNDLAPLVVSQLKAIKEAGFQEKTDVLVYFDPSERGTPTCLYHVNKDRRPKDPGDSFVRNMLEDDLDLTHLESTEAKAMKGCLEDPDNTLAPDALRAFLNFCVKEHQAKHYILFLVGHGMIVGNDAFMPDEEPGSAISLKDLKSIIKDFKEHVKDGFELLALNSCSMSAIEVAYELRDTANYMIASEGLAFVGSWPFRHMLMNLFNALKNNKVNSPADVAELLENLYYLAYFNARDFRLAGYPLELSLINLASQKYEKLMFKLGNLVNALKDGVSKSVSREKIQLAHLEAQSYYAENYTDLYDFCRCLGEKCSDTEVEAPIREYSTAVMNELKPKKGNVLERFQSLVVHSEHFGGKYQYSHGLSIYFPWSEPYQRAKRHEPNGRKVRNAFMRTYSEYDSNRDLGGNSWVSFLKVYFNETERPSRKRQNKLDRDKENMQPIEKPAKKEGPEKARELEFFDKDVIGPLIGNAADREDFWMRKVIDKPSGAIEKAARLDKSSGGTGPSCTCPVIKNYPKNVT